LSLGGEHPKVNRLLNFNKNNENMEIYFTLNRIFKYKEFVSNQHVCTKDLEKM